MKVEVLASVMNTTMEEIADKMNISSDAVIINQADHYAYEEMHRGNHRIRCFTCSERGIGRSRNEAIIRADGDICLFADEDIVYEDGYEDRILAEFKRQPRADLILFHVNVEEARATYHITDRKRVRWYNCGRYGAVSFAVRRRSLLESGVMFSLLFGGGAVYSNGEDSLFLKQFMDKGYKVYTAPVTIGCEESGSSTWFQGYNSKFFHDRGVLYHFLYGRLAYVMALRFLLVRKGKICRDVTVRQAFGWIRAGIRGIREEEGR